MPSSKFEEIVRHADGSHRRCVFISFLYLERVTSTSRNVTGTKEDMMVSNTTTDRTSEETAVDVDCFEVYGNKTIQIVVSSVDSFRENNVT